MKRKFILGLVLMLCMALLIGCGGASAENGQKKAASEDKSVTEVQPDDKVKDSAQAEETGKAGSDKTGEAVDKYQTAKIPEGKPVPVEPQETKVNKKKEYHATMSIVCSTILDNKDKFDESKLEVLPKDGIILAAKKVTFYEGESVFDVLLRETQNEKIHMEFVSTPIYNSNYIEGINNIYEFDCGELSGWMYKVNGWFPNYGCSRYTLKDGDKIEWVYTCDLGRDIGGNWAAQNQGKDQ